MKGIARDVVWILVMLALVAAAALISQHRAPNSAAVEPSSPQPLVASPAIPVGAPSAIPTRSRTGGGHLPAGFAELFNKEVVFGFSDGLCPIMYTLRDGRCTAEMHGDAGGYWSRTGTYVLVDDGLLIHLEGRPEEVWKASGITNSDADCRFLEFLIDPVDRSRIKYKLTAADGRLIYGPLRNKR